MTTPRLCLGAVALLAFVAETTAIVANCNSTFKPISASSFAAALHPGWNPGNTLDAPDGETTWGNPPLVSSTFANVKKSGFSGVRLPGSCEKHLSAL
jgi:endoglucanase